MAKFSFKRPRIISKKFPGVDSTIDGVTKSLNDLVFSYSEHIDKSLQKKHVMMAMSSLVLILVLGSFISPKGKADVSVFYPETCLGGWVNPQYAQGEQQTTSNADESQFTKDNSAVLPKNTDAEMYCGNFKGKFDQATKPTKIIVSFALTKGADLLLEDTIESGITGGTSSPEMFYVASTTDGSLLLASSTASSTLDIASSTSVSVASSTDMIETATTTSVETSSSSLQEGPVTASATPSAPLEDTVSAISEVIQSVKESIINLFENNKDTTPVTDTVIIPLPEPTPEPAPEPTPVPEATPTPEPTPEPTPAPAPESTPAPTSYVPFLGNTIVSLLFQKVFAQETEVAPVAQEVTPVAQEVLPEVVPSPTQTPETTPTQEPVVVPTAVQEEPVSTTVVSETQTETATISQEASSSPIQEVTPLESTTSTPPEATTPQEVVESLPVETPASPTILELITSTSSFFVATTTEATTTEVVSDVTASSTEVTTASSTEENHFQNNFLEAFYTFDGVTWTSLGELNEISMKYRTFEIPVTASTSWEEMAQLQVKLVAKRHLEDTPTIYLDAIKVEVLYETTLSHAHPDFARDTILKDETIDGIRIVTIINNDTNEEEVWYMILEESTTVSTGTLEVSTSSLATSTELVFSSMSEQLLVMEGASTSLLSTATGTESFASSTKTPVIVDAVIRKWKKYIGKEKPVGVTFLVEAIRKQEQEEKDGTTATSTKERLPDFALDTIKKIRGTFLNTVIVQLQKDGKEELWMYNIEKDTQEKIDAGTSTSLSIDSPLGIKDGYIFWLSHDRQQVFAYSLLTKEIQVKALPLYNATLGERGEVIFDTIPWKVIIGAENFSFFSDQTGEVFSDENGSVAEMLRQKFKLDSVLDKEELSSLNFQVEEAVDVTE